VIRVLVAARLAALVRPPVRLPADVG